MGINRLTYHGIIRNLMSFVALPLVILCLVILSRPHLGVPLPSPAPPILSTRPADNSAAMAWQITPPWHRLGVLPDTPEDTIPVPLFPDAPASFPEMTARLVITYTPGEINAFISRYARQHGLAENLVRAVIRQESGFNAGAVSPKGALGLMQLMPETAVMVGVHNPFDARENITGGVKFLRMCLNRFGQDLGLALAAYNAGPENVDKYQGCPPFAETQAYVAAIMTKLFGSTWPKHTKVSLPGTSPKPVQKAEDKGLDWKVPEPQCKVGAPTWKISKPTWKPKTASLKPATDSANRQTRAQNLALQQGNFTP